MTCMLQKYQERPCLFLAHNGHFCYFFKDTHFHFGAQEWPTLFLHASWEIASKTEAEQGQVKHCYLAFNCWITSTQSIEGTILICKHQNQAQKVFAPFFCFLKQLCLVWNKQQKEKRFEIWQGFLAFWPASEVKVATADASFLIYYLAYWIWKTKAKKTEKEILEIKYCSRFNGCRQHN